MITPPHSYAAGTIVAEVNENLDVWQRGWDWTSEGDEWSSWWGGTPALWHGALLPRIHSFVPAATILEIAPGFGRWTQYLKDLCDQLTIVDLTERCIEGCRERFADSTNIEYHVNDGRSLDMVADGSIDLCFSFDSLVHAEADVLEAYLDQLAVKLTPDGVGFFHHSNSGALGPLMSVTTRLPEPARRRLVRRGVLPDIYAWRARSVTASRFADQCRAAGLVCVSQEKINWEFGAYLTDALSVFTPRGSRWEAPPRVTRNPLFREEAKRMAKLYSAESFPGRPGAT
jgi:2-polyprenyl-3-methyl-5-hydroxy-6-metoxy-1,4-benzoquinol methylase